MALGERRLWVRNLLKAVPDEHSLKLNDLPVDAAGDFADVPEESLTEEQKAERRKRAKAGLSINETVARDANLSVGSRGTDTSGVESGAGAGAGLTQETPAAPANRPLPM